MADTTVGELLARHPALADISDTPALDCQILLGHILGQSRAWLIAHSGDVIPTGAAADFAALLARRGAGEPIAYLTGTQAFWDLDLEVSPATLVPRPDTETLVAAILDGFDNAPRVFADLGTGSGAIALAVANARPQWHVIATDLSAAALAVANRNRGQLANVRLLCGHWLACLAESSIDIIACNPPYIRNDDEHLPDLRFEPRHALVADCDGYADLATVIRDAPRPLKPGGTLIVEHGYEQQPRVLEMFRAAGFTATGLTDLGNRPRAVQGTLGTAP